MPDSYWTDRALMLLEDFMSHNLVRKHLSKDLLRALDAEHVRLADLCFAQMEAEKTKANTNA